MLISLDTETDGVDLHHFCKPFFVTITREDRESLYWEWDVDPRTRQPRIPEGHREEIQDEIDRATEIVMQNSRFDVRTCKRIGIEIPWIKVWDTILASHLLGSQENYPHDLTKLGLKYLYVDIEPYEERLGQACIKARDIIRRSFPRWRIAEEGDPLLPSANGGTMWKWDMWSPRALVKKVINSLRFDLLPNHPQQPTVGRISNCEVRIDRTTKWGNPFKITSTRSREQVVKEYARHIWESDLIDDLPELYGKTIGCHCSPELCHGDVLRALCHPFLTALSSYSNIDSGVTLPLWRVLRRRIQEQGLWDIYLFRRKLLPVIFDMEERGVTYSGDRLDKQFDEYLEESLIAEANCLEIANRGATETRIGKLPKSGASKELLDVFFNHFQLPILLTSKKTGEPSTKKEVLEQWEASLDEGPALDFVKNFRAKRKRDTALSYMKGYRRAALPLDLSLIPEKFRTESNNWFCLYPSLNETGTHTLRFSSSNPNEQNISKKEGYNLRYSFGPAPGREWWSIDYDNLELRIPAYEAGETEMTNLFERPDDPPYFGSYHMLVCDVLHPEKFAECLRDGEPFNKRYKSTWYSRTKNGNFAVQYGALVESGTANRAYGVPGAQERIMDRFKNVSQLNQAMIRQAQRTGRVFTMVDKEFSIGYPLQCPFNDNGKVKPTVPLNYHVQGTAMWAMCRAMVRCDEFLKDYPGRYITAQIHDELLFDFPVTTLAESLEVINELIKLMELSGDDLGLPLKVSAEYHPNNWSEGISYEELLGA